MFSFVIIDSFFSPTPAPPPPVMPIPSLPSQQEFMAWITLIGFIFLLIAIAVGLKFVSASIAQLCWSFLTFLGYYIVARSLETVFMTIQGASIQMISKQIWGYAETSFNSFVSKTIKENL